MAGFPSYPCRDIGELLPQCNPPPLVSIPELPGVDLCCLPAVLLMEPPLRGLKRLVPSRCLYLPPRRWWFKNCASDLPALMHSERTGTGPKKADGVQATRNSNSSVPCALWRKGNRPQASTRGRWCPSRRPLPVASRPFMCVVCARPSSHNQNRETSHDPSSQLCPFPKLFARASPTATRRPPPGSMSLWISGLHGTCLPPGICRRLESAQLRTSNAHPETHPTDQQNAYIPRSGSIRQYSAPVWL